jgi:hypothetical protein
MDITIQKHGGWKRTAIFWTDKSRTVRKDTTGKTLRIEIHRGNELLETLNEASGNVVHTPAQGQFNISITQAQVLAFEFQSAEFRVILDHGNDYPQVIDKGTIRIE